MRDLRRAAASQVYRFCAFGCRELLVAMSSLNLDARLGELLFFRLLTTENTRSLTGSDVKRPFVLAAEGLMCGY
jgi:hypothetical protein